MHTISSFLSVSTSELSKKIIITCCCCMVRKRQTLRGYDAEFLHCVKFDHSKEMKLETNY